MTLDIESLYADHSPALSRSLGYDMPTLQDAEDIAQDAWLAAVEGAKGYRGDGDPEHWVNGIAFRKRCDFYRRPWREESVDDHEEIEDVDRGYTLEIRQAFSRLKPQYQEALLLRYVYGHEVPEIQRRLGLTYKATESVLSRARAALKKELESD